MKICINYGKVTVVYLVHGNAMTAIETQYTNLLTES